MQLDTITFHNYKLHRNLKLELCPGVTGIVGDNGTGKTTIISGIRFIFTGEVDTDNKNKSITLGETEGWVSCSFTLNGKQGSLERHLSTSKVILKYDGVTYNKATEVKELWAKLLQIDASVFNNVIIAGQGEIPLLFDGDQSIRERIFQKIFLVPPTEKLRNTIWDYIKNCPPEKFEEDVSQLQSQEVEVARKRNTILADIDVKANNILNDTFMKCIVERIAFLEKCQRDGLARPGLEAQLTEVISQIDKANNSLVELSDIKTIDIDSLVKEHTKLVSQKQIYKLKKDLEDELYLLEAKVPTKEEQANQTEIVQRYIKEEEGIRQELADANSAYKQCNNELAKLSALDGSPICPTCGQSIASCQEAINTLKTNSEQLSKDVTVINAKYVLVSKKLLRARSDLSLIEGQIQRLNSLEQQIARYGKVSYSDEEFDILDQAIRVYREKSALYDSWNYKLVTLNSQKQVLEEKLKNLAKYDGNDSVEVELNTMREVIDENKRRVSELEEIRVEQAKLEHELQLLENRIKISLDHHKYNIRRQAYLDKLDKAYNVLHVSKFPRKLIQSYSEHVQVYLSNYLEKFNMPYKAKIVEGFKIQMVDSDDRELPMVSGGQKMIVGICLRLALHKMFAQSFPLWIIDEGTTHLDEANRKAYFKLIEEMRVKKIVNQVLIIDHDKQLQSVVDRTIQL